ncbi:Mariner Mos1 transposase [Acromyrmex echinatior]|uniref:Mariner Mos1 transposase n=1 Tax=Acromyrmex echinatior TaxID=103372 RepID=F4WUE2_ACREC|nr:Mariner Mos1 transposase [Acromyrmex echinatior]
MSNFVLTKQHLREVLIFCFNWKKSAAEAHRMLVEIYGDTAPTDKSCREWFRFFLEGRETLKDDKKSGRPILVRTPEMIEKVRDFVANDHNASLKMMEKALNISRETIRTILHEDLGKTKSYVAQWQDKFTNSEERPDGQTSLETLKWEVLLHPPYSPDVAPSDYHLFRSMAHDLADQHFRSYEEVKNWIDSWIASKDDQFFRRGIRMLPERWEKVVASDGQYFES